MKTTKVTVEVPSDLLSRAQSTTGEGITATVRRGLELVASARAQQRLRALRGRVKVSVDLVTSRQDRA